IVPVRQVAGDFGSLGSGSASGLDNLFSLLLHVGTLLILMLIGTGIGVYAMLRAERLTGQFVEGVAFGEGLLGGPMRLRGQLAARASRQATESPEEEEGPYSEGGAQQATTMSPGGRLNG